MGVTGAFQRFRDLVSAAENLDGLGTAISRITRAMGFDYYAIGHHLDWGDGVENAFRLQNYPTRWVSYYDGNHYGGRDPVHRAAGRAQRGFLWREAAEIIEMTGSDEHFMELAGRNGIGDGFTVPANVPGEFQGSCTFATVRGRPLNEDALILGRLIAPELFAAGRRIIGIGQLIQDIKTARLTNAQRACLLWVAAGKSDWETGKILGIGEATVRQHIRDGCRRLGIDKRPLLLFLAVRNGAISLNEIPFR